MNAVGGNVAREKRVAADKENNAAFGADAAELPGIRGAARVVIIAQDDRRARRQRLGDERCVGSALAIRREGERERHGLGQRTAPRIEGASRGC